MDSGDIPSSMAALFGVEGTSSATTERHYADLSNAIASKMGTSQVPTPNVDQSASFSFMHNFDPMKVGRPGEYPAGFRQGRDPEWFHWGNQMFFIQPSASGSWQALAVWDYNYQG